MPSAWVKHVQSVYAKIKGKGGSYRAAMVQAKKSWAKKKGTAARWQSHNERLSESRN